MSRVVAVAVVGCLTWTAISGCGATDDATTDGASPVVIDIAISESTVSPNGKRVAVDVGQRVDLVVRAEESGELHVHTRPEAQEFSYEPGTTTFMLEIDSPGVVEVESHDLDKIIVQLEVR